MVLMAQPETQFNPLLLVLIGVVSFASGLFFFALVVIILSALGILSL